jgi:hypothetical protein
LGCRQVICLLEHVMKHRERSSVIGAAGTALRLIGPAFTPGYALVIEQLNISP